MKQTLPLLVLSSLLAVGSAHAAVNVTLSQVGSDVVVMAAGTLNVNDLTLTGSGNMDVMIVSGWSVFFVGESGSYQEFSGGNITGPDTFGGTDISGKIGVGTGDFFGFQGSWLFPVVFVPNGYVSGDYLEGTSTFVDTTLEELDVVVGTYIWTWGAGLNADSLTVTIVPEPSTYALVGLAGLAGLVVLRRRKH